MSEPVPLIGWDASDSAWRTARQAGLGASEVAAALGLSRWSTPWEVWADKTGVRRADRDSDAAELGRALEPWLIDQAAVLLGEPVERTPARLYAHPEHGWRMTSPDGQAKRGALVEGKTAGLLNEWADLTEWADDRVPLVYEFQARWQMHVMNAPTVHLVALVAGLGVILRTVERDVATEAELVRQTSEWWSRHVASGVEPPVCAADASLLGERWPTPDGTEIALDDTDAAALLALRRGAATRVDTAQSEVDDLDAQLRALIGPHSRALLNGRRAYSAPAYRGRVDWKTYAETLTNNPTAVLDPDQFRGQSSRRILIAKEWK